MSDSETRISAGVKIETPEVPSETLRLDLQTIEGWNLSSTIIVLVHTLELPASSVTVINRSTGVPISAHETILGLTVKAKLPLEVQLSKLPSSIIKGSIV